MSANIFKTQIEINQLQYILNCLCIEIFDAVFIPESQYLVFPEYFDV